MINTKRISRIVVAEANLFFRRGLLALYATDPSLQIVGEARSADETLAQVVNLKPAVLVIDAAFFLEDHHGHFSTAIRQSHPEMSILILAAADSEGTMETAVSCGAKSLILKSAVPANLLAATRNVAFQEGGMNHSGLLPEFHALARQAPTNPSISVLTAREQEVVRFLAEGKTVRAVANELSLSMKTVEAHKLNLMRKLDIHDRATLVAYANRMGISTLPVKVAG